MKRRSIAALIDVLAVCLISHGSPSVLATNVTWQQVGENIEILYDLPDALEHADYYVRIALLNNADQNFRIVPASVTGDINKGSFHGKNRRIVWNYLIDVPKGLSGEGYFFEVDVKRYEPGDETIEKRVITKTMHTGQELQLLCPYNDSGLVRVYRGAEFVSKSYQELLTGDTLLSYDSAATRITNCAMLNDALRGDFLLVGRADRRIVYKLPGVRQQEKLAALEDQHRKAGEQELFTQRNAQLEKERARRAEEERIDAIVNAARWQIVRRIAFGSLSGGAIITGIVYNALAQAGIDKQAKIQRDYSQATTGFDGYQQQYAKERKDAHTNILVRNILYGAGGALGLGFVLSIPF